VVSYESIKELTDVLIKAFGQHNAGAEAITDRCNKLEARMAEKRQENKGQKVMVLQSAPPRHYIQGKDGTLGSMLDMLGYENVYQNNKMVLIDLEQALSYEPDLLFCVGGSKTAAEHQQVMEEDFAKNPEYWNNIKAIREHEVIYLPIKYVATAGINVIDNINELIDIIDAKKLKQNG
nr:ABC transporter substrate-binding protein [Phascolarctobacterium sp.]